MSDKSLVPVVLREQIAKQVAAQGSTDDFLELLDTADAIINGIDVGTPMTDPSELQGIMGQIRTALPGLQADPRDAFNPRLEPLP